MTPRELLLEQVAAGEREAPADLTPQERARVDALRAENEALLARHPSPAAAAAIRARATLAPRRLVMLLPAAAALSLLLFVVGRGTDEERDKGGRPQLRAYLDTPEGPRLLDDGAEVHGGDVVQLTYVAAGASYAVLLSVDSAGGVTLHHPAAVGATALAAARGEARLPYAFRLDETPGEERFFLVTSQERLDARTVVAAAETMARNGTAVLSLGAGAQQTLLVLRKALADAGVATGTLRRGIDGGIQ